MSEPDRPCSTMKHFSKSQNLKVNKYIKDSKESRVAFVSLEIKDSVTYYHTSNKFFCIPDDQELNPNHSRLVVNASNGQKTATKMNSNVKKFTLQAQ